MVPGDFLAIQDGLDHFLVEDLLVVLRQVHRFDDAHLVFVAEDHRQPRGSRALAEVLRQRRGVGRGGGVQGQGPGGLVADVAGGLLGPVLEQGDVGLQHFPLLGAQLLFQDFLEALLEFPLGQDAHLPVDEAQEGGPGEVPVQVLEGGPGAVDGHELDLPVLDQGLHLGRKGGHDVVAALGGVDHQEAVFFQAAHILLQDLVREELLIEEGQDVPFRQFRTVADGLPRDAQVHEHRGAFAGGAVAGPGLDVFLARADVLGIDQGRGLQRRLDPFGAHADEGHAQLPLQVAGQGGGPERHGAFDPHVKIPLEAPLLFVKGEHVLHHRGGVVFVEVLAAQAVDPVEQGGHVLPAIDAVLFLAFPAGPDGDLQGGLHVRQQELVVGGAGPLQDGDHLGLAHAVGQLFIAGRVEQHRPHHPDLVALHVPVVVHHVLDHAGGGAQDDHHHVGVFGAVALHHLEVGAQDLVHDIHGQHEAPPEKAVRQVLGHLAFHGQVRVGEGAGEGAVLEVGLVDPVGRPHVILQEGVGEFLDVFDGVALDEAVADDHGGQHHLFELAHLEGHGQQVVQLLVVLAHQLGPAGVAHRVEVGVAAVDAQRALVDFPGHDGHHHRQALARHGKEVLGLEEQALGRGVVGIAPALAGHGLHRGDGREFVARAGNT